MEKQCIIGTIQMSESDHGGGRGGGISSCSRSSGRPAGVDLVLLCVCMPQRPT